MTTSLRHPARHYIYYLLSRRSAKIKDVLEHLSALEIPLPQETDRLLEFIQRISAVQKNMQIPPGFDPLAAVPNAQTAAFLEKWKIGSMWKKGDPFISSANDILFDPHIRRTVEVLLLGPLSPIHIARRVCVRHGLPEAVINPRVIREYGHYYWNYGVMNTSQWKEFLRDHFPKYFDNSDYAMALTVPRTKEGALLSLAMSDRGADAMSDTEMYTVMRNSAAMAFMQHALLERPSVNRSQGMLSAMTTFKMATEELDKHRGASAELLDELRKMEPVYDRRPMATIHDLPISRPTALLPNTNKEEVPQ